MCVLPEDAEILQLLHDCKEYIIWQPLSVNNNPYK